MNWADVNWPDMTWLGWRELEWLANGFYTASVVVAARNSIHTWWTGIVGSSLFALVFFNARLYADVTLMLIFVLTSAAGWWQWHRGNQGAALPVTRIHRQRILLYCVPALLVTLGYGALLHAFTDAYAPFWDSAVLGFSLLALFLLLRRKLESWYVWILVNLLAIPLYSSRELYVTAVMYTCYLLNAVYGLRYWRSLLRNVQVQHV